MICPDCVTGVDANRLAPGFMAVCSLGITVFSHDNTERPAKIRVFQLAFQQPQGRPLTETRSCSILTVQVTRSTSSFRCRGGKHRFL
jgi:hypothetical protein